MGNGPLTGIRVLDLTQFEAGTACTENLAWLGAEIWKVERPGTGELGRYSAVSPDVDTYGFVLLNMNKKSITCNMKKPEGLALIKQLLPKVDVIAENMGPGSMERLGLSYEECKAINDKIVYCSIKGFARNSPYANYPAFDPIATHTGGFVAATGLLDSKKVLLVNELQISANSFCLLFSSSSISSLIDSITPSPKISHID